MRPGFLEERTRKQGLVCRKWSPGLGVGLRRGDKGPVGVLDPTRPGPFGGCGTHRRTAPGVTEEGCLSSGSTPWEQWVPLVPSLLTPLVGPDCSIYIREEGWKTEVLCTAEAEPSAAPGDSRLQGGSGRKKQAAEGWDPGPTTCGHSLVYRRESEPVRIRQGRGHTIRDLCSTGG